MVKKIIFITFCILLCLCSCNVLTLNSVKYGDVVDSASNVNLDIKEYKTDIDVYFQFKYNKINDTYEDLFQTASENNGLRCEFSNGGVNGNWGIIGPQQNENKQLFSIQETSLPLANVWHSINIKIINDKAGVYLDGALIDEKDINSKSIRYDDFALGTGFSKTRNFNGEIKNFKFRSYKHTNFISLLPFLIVLFMDMFLVYHLFKSTDNHINLKRVKTFILVILSLGLIYRGTRMYIMSCDQFFCYAILVGVYLIGYYIWSKFNLRCYELSTFIIGLFIFIKCFLIRLSFYGSLVDFITGLFVIAIVQFASVKIVNSKLYAGIIAAGSSIFLGFFTMAAFYVRSVGNPGMPFGEEVQAIMQTNPQEALEFVQTLFTSKQLFMGACILAFYMFLIYRVSVKNSTNVKFNRLQKIFIAGSVVMLCGVNYSLGVTQSIMAPIYSLVQGYSKSMEQMRYYQELRSNNSNIVATKESKGETYVVVIGESANKRHMSAYGYFRNTTPWLESLRENGNAIFMENAYASYVHTVPALLNALTAANQYNQKVNFIEPSIVEVAKAAGFRTYWFSNQNRYGLIDNPLTIVADQADEVYWTPTSNRGPDGELVKLLDKKLSNLNPETNNLIIVHLIGSHESYIKRLPEGYNTSWQENGIEYFGDIAKDSDYMKSAVDPYDATIKYTDENLEKIYDLIKSRVNDLSAFVYVSDHGQDVFGRMNHNAATFNFEMARIPMITLISDNWKRRNEGMFEQMKLHSMSPYTTDCFYDYLVGLSGISTEIYEKEKDLTSESYNLTWDNSMIMWTDKNLQLQFYSKSSPHNLSEDTAKIRTDN